MPWVSGVVRKYIKSQIFLGAGMSSSFRGLEAYGLYSIWKDFVGSWKSMFEISRVSHALRTTWYPKLIPRDLMYETPLKQAYKYSYEYTVGTVDKDTGGLSHREVSLYSNQQMSREEANVRIISKLMVGEGGWYETNWYVHSVKLNLVSHNIAMDY